MILRTLRLAVLPAAVGAGLAVEWISYNASEGPARAAADLVVGCVLIAGGAFAWDRRRESRIGPLVLLAGLTWFLGNLATPLAYLHRAPIFAALLTYPTGRVRTRLVGGVIAAVTLYAAVEPLARHDAVTLGAIGVVAFTSAFVFARSSGPTRKALGTALIVTLAVAAVLALGAAGRLIGRELSAILWLYDAAIALGMAALLVDLVRARWTEAVVTGLVVDLGSAAEAGTLGSKLARALGDPALAIAYRVDDGDGFVDDAGRPVQLPLPGSGRTVTPLVDRRERVAVLVHDEALLADPELVAAVAAAARVALANVSLQAEARAKAVELSASRRRIVEAASVERLQIRRQLHRGAGRRLEAAAALLAVADSTLPEISELAGGLAAMRLELDEFARGLHPAALAEGGLAPALAQLAERSAVPVAVTGTVGRLPAALEAALYFVCSEAVANVAKHAAASAVSIHLQADTDSVNVEVVDDGVGGACPSRGSGLAGLVDRVEAFDGRLQVDSPAGRGTRVIARLPLSGGRARAASPSAPNRT